jgi:flagellar biosynthesis/type III secretory pathway chaperone
VTTDSRSAARARLEGILADSAQQADRLRSVLKSERAALEHNDADALDAAAAAKAEPVARLATLDTERAGAGREAGFTAGSAAMDEIIAWCDEGSVLANGWRRLLEIARDCERLNATNGAIIRLRRQHVAARLTMLRGSEFDGDTYAASGIEAPPPGGRALAQA